MLSFGIHSIDEAIMNTKSEKLVLVAGRPASGKTALACQAALASARGGANVLYFSMELPASFIGWRLLRMQEEWSRVRLNMTADHIPSLDIEFFPLHCDARDSQSAHVKVYCCPCQSPHSIFRTVQQALRKKNTPLVVIVDYLQLMNADMPDPIEDNPKHFAIIARELGRLLCREGVGAILLLSNLPYYAERRTDKMPRLSDLESRGLSESADVVMLLQGETDCIEDEPLTFFRPPRPAKLLIAKHSEREPYGVDLLFDQHSLMFFDACQSIEML